MFIHHHLGLGDHLICNGLVRIMAKQRPVSLFTKQINCKNISLMYSDNRNITIIPINNDMEAATIGQNSLDYIQLGIALNNNFVPGVSWDEVFYNQANIDFICSWSEFKFNKSVNQNPIPTSSYAFLCSHGSDGIDGLDYTKINSSLTRIYSNRGEFFDNIDLIYHASEIHCINSSYIHLIDRIKNLPSNIKLFYHKYYKLKPYSNFRLKKIWNII